MSFRCVATLCVSAMIFMSGHIMAAESVQTSTAQLASLTPAQTSALTACFYRAESINRIASAKMQGLSHEGARQRVVPPNPAILSMVETVYAATFTDAWSFSLQDYTQCAANSTHASQNLITSSVFCVQNGMIADSAAEARRLGIAKEQVYARYNRFMAEPLARMAIDSVYAQDRIDGKEAWRNWSWCISQITGRGPSTQP
jgi:hypothetical protein